MERWEAEAGPYDALTAIDKIGWSVARHNYGTLVARTWLSLRDDPEGLTRAALALATPSTLETKP